MKKLLTLASLGLCLVGSARAQQSADPNRLPEGPLLNKLPVNSRCVVSVTNLAAKPSAEGQPAKALVQRITMINAGQLGVKTVEDIPSKTSTQTWMVGDYNVEIDPTTKEAFAMKASSGSVHAVADRDGSSTITIQPFPGLDCVNAKHFTGMTRIGDRKCMAFTDPETEASAYVDLLTRLPVSARIEDSAYTYQFSAAPAGAINVPPDALKAIAEVKERYQRAEVGIP